MIWGSLNTLSGSSVCPFQIFNRILLYYVLNMLLDYVLNCHLPPDLIIVISCLFSRQHFYIFGRSLKQTKLDNRRSVPGKLDTATEILNTEGASIQWTKSPELGVWGYYCEASCIDTLKPCSDSGVCLQLNTRHWARQGLCLTQHSSFLGGWRGGCLCIELCHRARSASSDWSVEYWSVFLTKQKSSGRTLLLMTK